MADENTQVATELLPQRWMCLVAMVVAIFFMQFSLIIMPGIAGTIIPEMGLDPAKFGMLANMPYLAGVLFGVIMGNVGDKVGIKKIMTISIVVFIIGAFWRWQSVGSYAMLMVSSLVMGFGLAVLNANSTKGIRLWFPGKAHGSLHRRRIAWRWCRSVCWPDAGHEHLAAGVCRYRRHHLHRVDSVLQDASRRG